MAFETPWDEATVARLREEWALGYSTGEIGRRMGISKNAVVWKAHRLNLPARPSPIVRSGTPLAPRAPRVRGATLPPLASAEKPLAVMRTPEPRPLKPGRAVPLEITPPERVAPPAPAEVAVAFLRARAALAKASPVRPPPRPCCWPIGEPRTPSFRFCRAESEPGRPYCAEHCKLAYVRVSAS